MTYAKDVPTLEYNLNKCQLLNVFLWTQSLNFPNPDNPDIEDYFEQFCNELSSCIRCNSPIRKVFRSNFTVWFTPELRRLVYKKKLLHKRYTETLNFQLYDVLLFWLLIFRFSSPPYS